MTLIFADGACSGNPGPGGWGAVVLTADGAVRELGGAQARTTNNRMELTAALMALRAVELEAGDVELNTDSSYVIQGMRDWLGGWRRRGWIRPDGSPVLNRDLWEALAASVARREALGRMLWRHVRGHSGVEGNERADRIAAGYARGLPPDLYSGPVSGYEVDLSSRAAPAGRPYYLSALGRAVQRHATWEECRARVEGRTGARYKKVRSRAEEERALRDWGVSGGPARGPG